MDDINALECLHDKCEDCEYWNGTECSGDLPTEGVK